MTLLLTTKGCLHAQRRFYFLYSVLQSNIIVDDLVDASSTSSEVTALEQATDASRYCCIHNLETGKWQAATETLFLPP